MVLSMSLIRHSRRPHPIRQTAPYSASKAGSDHLVRAYHHTYGLPTLTTNCSNNYGPYQFPEKLIPLVVHNALNGKKIPVYGDGSNVRDWHLRKGPLPGDHSSHGEGQSPVKSTISVETVKKPIWKWVHTICSILDDLKPRDDQRPYDTLVEFVTDRPGHDQRYAIDASKIKAEIGWTPEETFETGIRETVQWYLDNTQWVTNVTSGAYQNWVKTNYGRR
jgi:dTDP-glucose 4,6-dehydratase